MAMDSNPQPKPREVKIRVHDGVEIAVALYMPDGEGPFPVLLAPSPYRYDNNTLPASPQFLWRETGPIDFYLKHGYVYANMDVRGCGKSGGEFRLLDNNEQRDLYDVIEWLGAQPWSSGKVGGIGQSYFCMSQWWMAIRKPPSLACIAAFDGLNDPYRASVYQGGILGDFFGAYWWNQNRIINRHPANGEQPREQLCDLNLLIQQHPTYDDFWKERCAAERLDEIEVPLYSVGVWGKVDLHTRGNIDGFRRARGPKKLKMVGPPNAFAANREFNSAEMHERVLLPFYDHYLKGKDTDYVGRPAVEYFVRGADTVRTAETWPPPGVRYITWNLSAQTSGSVTSLNDGTLTRGSAAGEAATSYSYPNPGWMMGVVGFGPNNAPDPARRVLTFTTAPLAQDLEIAGPIKLTLLCLIDPQRHGFLRQALRADAAAAGRPRQGAQPGLLLDHQGLAARFPSRARCAEVDRDGALSHPHRSAADRAGQNLSLRHLDRADGAPLQGRQPHPAGNRQRRLRGDRRAVDALLHPQQDRHRHDLSLGGIPLRLDAAGDGRGVSHPARRQIPTPQ